MKAVYWAFCEECSKEGIVDPMRKVSSKTRSGKQLCRKHSLAARPKTVKKPKPRAVSKEAIAKVRSINKQHRDEVAKLPKRIKQKLSNDDMISLWLKHKKPSVIDICEGIPHAIVSGLGSRTSVMS